MSQRVRRNYLRKTTNKGEEAKVYVRNADKKGQVRFNLRGIEDKGPKEEEKRQYDSKGNQDDIFDKICSSPMKQNVNMKPLSFWRKKLQDLESEETKNKPTKFGLYEFSASEESFSPNKRKKKIKRKCPAKKKKQCEFPITSKKSGKTDPKLKVKEIVKESKDKAHAEENAENHAEALTENKENDMTPNSQLTSSTSKINFFTSTPAPIMSKLVNSSNFMFLSPIECEKEERNENKRKNNVPEAQQLATTPKLKVITNKNPQEEGKCLRVLRSRKILIP